MASTRLQELKKDTEKNNERFNDLHFKLIKLGMYEMADDLSTVFYGAAHTRYCEGMSECKDIYNL